MTIELFVYWKTDAHRADAGERAAREFQRAQRAVWPALRAALYRRADEAGDRVTIMETYAGVAGEPELDALLSAAQAALSGWARDGRHVERFRRLPD